jgi:nucleoside phosphorylase
VSGLVLICAATSVEARACRTGIERAGATARFEILQTGMGRVAAEKVLRERLGRGARPEWIVSSGFAGSRMREAEFGSWAMATSIEAGAVSGRINELISRAGLSVIAAPWQMVDAVAGAQAQVPEGIIVDMESGALGSVAAAEGIPFDVLRVISDTLERPIPQAVAMLSSATLESDSSARRGAFTNGLMAALREPGRVLDFGLRTMKLPAVLADGWAALARSPTRA